MQRFNVAAYLRLSKEEFSNEKESNGITNQKLNIDNNIKYIYVISSDEIEVVYQ